MGPPANPGAGAGRKCCSWQLPVILLIALALRLTYLDLAQGQSLSNQTDSIEAYEVAASYEAGDERAQYIGQPNCNTHSKLPGPAWTLFCVAGLKLFGSPKGIVLLIILANLAAIALTWCLARDLAGKTAADLAALFMAVSLWAVHYSAIIWNPSPMPLFGAVIFLSLFRCLRHKKSPAIFAVPFLILIGAQFHMSVLSLIVPLILFGWLARLQPDWRWLAAGVVAALLAYTPYILGDMRHGWANTHGILTGGAGGFSTKALKVFTSPFSFFINLWNPAWTYTPAQFQALARQAFGGVAGQEIINLISVGFTVFLVLGAIQAMRTAMKNRPVAWRERLTGSPGLPAVAFLLLTYLAFHLMTGKPFQGRYCMLVLPLLFTLAGAGAAQCLHSPRWKNVFLPLLVISVVADLWFMSAISRFEGDRIAHGPVFVPGFDKLDFVYQELKSRAPGYIVVRDHDYLTTIPLDEKDDKYRHAGLISRYIKSRELELQAAGTTFAQTNFFDLRAASLVNSNDPAVAFYGNGIALVAAPE